MPVGITVEGTSFYISIYECYPVSLCIYVTIYVCMSLSPSVCAYDVCGVCLCVCLGLSLSVSFYLL